MRPRVIVTWSNGLGVVLLDRLVGVVTHDHAPTVGKEMAHWKSMFQSRWHEQLAEHFAHEVELHHFTLLPTCSSAHAQLGAIFEVCYVTHLLRVGGEN